MKNQNFFIDLSPEEVGYADYAQALEHAKKTYGEDVNLNGLALANTFEQKHIVWYGTVGNQVIAFPAFAGVMPPPLGGYYFAEYRHLAPKSYFARKGTLFFYTLTRVIIKYKVLYHEDLVKILQEITQVTGLRDLVCVKHNDVQYLVWEIRDLNKTSYIPVFDEDKEVVLSHDFEITAKKKSKPLYNGGIFINNGIQYVVHKDKDGLTFIRPV